MHRTLRSRTFLQNSTFENSLQSEKLHLYTHPLEFSGAKIINKRVKNPLYYRRIKNRLTLGREQISRSSSRNVRLSSVFGLSLTVHTFLRTLTVLLVKPKSSSSIATAQIGLMVDAKFAATSVFLPPPVSYIQRIRRTICKATVADQSALSSSRRPRLFLRALNGKSEVR